MAWEEKQEEKEAELRERLAPHVEGELLAALPVTTGGGIVRGLRTPPAGLLLQVLAGPVARMRGEVTGLPLNALLALTADDVYVFPRLSAKYLAEHEPRLLRRWPRASLESVEMKAMARGTRIFFKTDDGKKAIFWGPATGDLRDRVRSALSAAGDGAGEPSA